jgi:hypothetical protein
LGKTRPVSQFRLVGAAYDFNVALPKVYEDDVEKQGIVFSSG